MTNEYRKLTRPLVMVYIITTALFLAFRSRLEMIKMDVTVLICANLLLFVVSMLILYLQMKNLTDPNPNAMVRGVIGGTFVKLFVLAAAVIIYLIAAGARKSVNAVLGAMGLYIIYTWLEVKISLRLTAKK